MFYEIFYLSSSDQTSDCGKLYEIFNLSWLIRYLTVENFMRYLIQVSLINYRIVESFGRYLIEVGMIKYLTV